MKSLEYQYIVVGSGAGGATVARELSRLGKSVLVIEKGIVEKKVGTFLDSVRYYDANKITKIPAKSIEGITFWRAFMAGGSTMVSMGNGVRCLEKELAEYGLHLEEEFVEAEQELGINALPDRLISSGGLQIRSAAQSLGHQFQNTPKMIDFSKCKGCGLCSLGCPNGAKWTTVNYLEEAQKLGAHVKYQSEVTRIIRNNGRASGVLINAPEGQTEITAEVIILAAGGLSTPVLLQRSGIPNAGTHLFTDILVNTYGVTDNFGMLNEPQMALIDLEHSQDQGFILSTAINHSREVRLIELGLSGYAMPTNRVTVSKVHRSGKERGLTMNDLA